MHRLLGKGQGIQKGQGKMKVSGGSRWVLKKNTKKRQLAIDSIAASSDFRTSQEHSKIGPHEKQLKCSRSPEGQD